MPALLRLAPWFLLMASMGCAAPPVVGADPGYEVIGRYPHDTRAFTQGLLFHDGELYESTGLYGHSTVRRVDPVRGDVQARRQLADELFGEGLALVGDTLIQLTWREGVALVYDRQTLEPLARMAYAGEGWGLAYDGRWLVMSDGSAELRFVDPDDLAEHRRLTVTDRGRPVTRLNELEVIEGEIWANILGSDRIARIDPLSGEVNSWLDLRALRKRMGSWWRARDLNGIAYDAQTARIFITGKNWPEVYVLRLTE